MPPRLSGAKGLSIGELMRALELVSPMDIASYLEQNRKDLGRKTKNIKDFHVFDFHYIPEQPLLRDEAKALIDEMLRFEISGIPNHQAIVGSRGSGKTLTVKYLQRIMRKHTSLEVLYANCRHHNTSFKVLAHLAGVQARGMSMTEVFGRFCRRWPAKTVVLLDEIDLMSAKDRRREILYLLSRSEQPFMAVLLSNRPHVLNELDAATKSSLQPWPRHFRNYGADQIQAILLDRAQRGLRQWDKGMLAEIAALTARLTNSDTRVAIKTLQNAVSAQGKDLRHAFEQARHDLIADMISDLSDSTLLILWAVVSADADLAKTVFGRYRHLCTHQSERPFSYMHFSSNLSYLQSAGLVALVSTKIRRAYTNRVLPTFDAGVAKQICRLRFGK